jgi:hypothetical protein
MTSEIRSYIPEYIFEITSYEYKIPSTEMEEHLRYWIDNFSESFSQKERDRIRIWSSPYLRVGIHKEDVIKTLILRVFRPQCILDRVEDIRDRLSNLYSEVSWVIDHDLTGDFTYPRGLLLSDDYDGIIIVFQEDSIRISMAKIGGHVCPVGYI